MVSWLLPSLSYPEIKISIALLNVFGSSLNNLSNFLWNILPLGVALSSSLIYLYLPNVHNRMVRYDDFSLSFKLWYLELMYMSVRDLTCTNLGRMSLTVSPLCTVLNSACFGLNASRHDLTFPLIWLLIQNCCTILKSHQFLMVQLFVVFLLDLFIQMTVVMHRPRILRVLGMA